MVDVKLITVSEPLILDSLTAFSVGGRRRCYVHPGDAAKCVKVLRTDPGRVVKRNLGGWCPSFLRGEYDNNADELHELEKLRRKLGTDLMARHFPRSYGMIDTDLGPGLVLDLVRDADGRISRSLREQLADGADLARFQSAYNDFGRFLIENSIITRELLDHNLAVRHDVGGSYTFILIDGFGDSSSVPVGNLIPGLMRRRIKRKIVKGWARFEKFAADLADPAQAGTVIKWRNGFLAHR